MNCRSKTHNMSKKGFSLAEVTMAVMILALISSSVLVVIDRCVTSAANSEKRMKAFEVARENMEMLLASTSVKESVEYGQSEQYPEIGWQTVVETFYEPITARMWLRGVCTAEYNDPNGEQKTIELTNWLTDLTKEQLLQVMNQGDEEVDVSAELIETMEEAAEYAGVDFETIEEWLQNGMITTEDGSFIKPNLDLYKRSNGNPSEEDKKLQVQSEDDLKKRKKSGDAGSSGEQGWQDEIDPKTGLTYGELQDMDFSEIWDLLQKQRR